MAMRSGLTRTDAANLIRMHKYAYRTFWQWAENTIADGLFTGSMSISSGWRRLIADDPTPSVFQTHLTRSLSFGF